MNHLGRRAGDVATARLPYYWSMLRNKKTPRGAEFLNKPRFYAKVANE
jgi:hypothetical protein